MTCDDVVCGLEGLNALVQDPQTQTYGIRVDRALIESTIAKWEDKGYIKLEPDKLVWTPLVVGRAGGINSLSYNTAAWQVGAAVGTSTAKTVHVPSAVDVDFQLTLAEKPPGDNDGRIELHKETSEKPTEYSIESPTHAVVKSNAVCEPESTRQGIPKVAGLRILASEHSKYSDSENLSSDAADITQQASSSAETENSVDDGAAAAAPTDEYRSAQEEATAESAPSSESAEDYRGGKAATSVSERHEESDLIPSSRFMIVPPQKLAGVARSQLWNLGHRVELERGKRKRLLSETADESMISTTSTPRHSSSKRLRGRSLNHAAVSTRATRSNGPAPLTELTVSPRHSKRAENAVTAQGILESDIGISSPRQKSRASHREISPVMDLLTTSGRSMRAR